MYYQNEAEKKERRRLITFAIATVALILILIIAIVVVATKKSSSTDVSKDVNNSELVQPVDEEKEDNKEETKEEKTEEKTDLGVLSTDTTSDTPAVVDTSDMPTTGPEDVLPLALVLGSLTAFGASAVMAKREQ